jgi:hypothetical protein
MKVTFDGIEFGSTINNYWFRGFIRDGCIVKEKNNILLNKKNKIKKK